MTKQKLYDTFPGASFDFLRIAELIGEMAEDNKAERDTPDAEDVMQCVLDAINDGLIYTRDQWQVLEYYCTPEGANLSEALEQFAEDVYNLLEVTE